MGTPGVIVTTLALGGGAVLTGILGWIFNLDPTYAALILLGSTLIFVAIVPRIFFWRSFHWKTALNVETYINPRSGTEQWIGLLVKNESHLVPMIAYVKLSRFDSYVQSEIPLRLPGSSQFEWSTPGAGEREWLLIPPQDEAVVNIARTQVSDNKFGGCLYGRPSPDFPQPPGSYKLAGCGKTISEGLT